MGSFNPVLIRINTDAGISGIGEVGLAYGAGAKAGGPWIEGRVHLRGSWTENEYPWFFEDDRRALSSSDNYEPPFAYVRATPRTKPDWFEGARLR